MTVSTMKSRRTRQRLLVEFLVVVTIWMGEVLVPTTHTRFASANDVLSQQVNDDGDGAECDGFTECLPWRNPQQNQPPINISDTVCGIWLAPSSIPGAGLGVFAGKDYSTGDAIGASGDITIPIVDLDIHQPGLSNGKWTFLWEDYVWNTQNLQMIHEGWTQSSKSLSPGISCAVNCFQDLVNVVDWQPTHSMPLDRRFDPGSGAITTYDTRWTTATRNIQAGQELFLSYSDAWFHRRPKLGPVPLTGDLKRASDLFRRYQELIHNSSMVDPIRKAPSTGLWKELWSTFVTKSAWKVKSRTLGSFNNSNTDAEMNDLQNKYNGSLFQLRRAQTTRDPQWLERHGECVDHLREEPSTLPHAGRGAFTTRFLPKGTVVAPMPMVHIPYDYRLNMYELTTDAKGKKVVAEPKRVVGKQLLLNYCYGHQQSTMLLCPYGSYVNVVNHNQTLANVRLRWADPNKSFHNASVLEQSVAHVDATHKQAVLAMELVATRDIGKGEEIFLDYGDAWEAAFQHHVQSWRPHTESYSAGHWNADKTTRLRTAFELMGYPYPGNIELKCDQAFRMETSPVWQPLLNEENASEALETYRHWATETLASCDVLQSRHDGHRFLYTAMINRLDSPSDMFETKENFELMVDVPREAFFFVDRPYTSDLFLPNVFRHAIIIPDELFPEAWKNRN